MLYQLQGGLDNEGPYSLWQKQVPQNKKVKMMIGIV